MAKIKEFPAFNIIRGFKGTLDFYLWKGITCVRSWPKSPGKSRSPAVTAQWPAWAYASRAWSNLPASLRTLFQAQAAGTMLTGRDLFMRSYLSGAFSYPTGV